MSAYDIKPKRLLTQLFLDNASDPVSGGYCAGFELEAWRCDALASHLIEWIADYALQEDELKVHHANMYVRIREAAARVYSSEQFKQRGEVGEIALHAICRDFFDTVPFAPRVFYLTSSNDVVKSFDLAHIRDIDQGGFEIWLGEAKFYADGTAAMEAAVSSVSAHINQGFLQNQKLILGPQVSKSLPKYQEIRDLLSVEASIDDLFRTAVFPICIACNSEATASSKAFTESYTKRVESEMAELMERLKRSDLTQKIRILFIYLPLGSKQALADAFDKRLKGLCA